MAFFDDFKTALEDYPGASVALAITNLAIQTGTPGSINVNETWSFKVDVVNNGVLDMSNVELHVLGQNDTLISTTGPAGPFLAGYQTFGALTVNAGGSQKSGSLYLKAPTQKKAAGTDLVAVHINNWDASLSNLLVAEAGHSAVGQATYQAQVFP